MNKGLICNPLLTAFKTTEFNCLFFCFLKLYSPNILQYIVQCKWVSFHLYARPPTSYQRLWIAAPPRFLTLALDSSKRLRCLPLVSLNWENMAFAVCFSTLPITSHCLQPIFRNKYQSKWKNSRVVSAEDWRGFVGSFHTSWLLIIGVMSLGYPLSWQERLRRGDRSVFCAIDLTLEGNAYMCML